MRWVREAPDGYDEPRHDGGSVVWALAAVGLALVAGSAILSLILF